MAQVETIAVAQTLRPVPTGRWHYIALAAIVLLGFGLRFAWLDRPALWGDEAATWARTCGTFDQMLKGNQDDGFVPLHYELYWALNQQWPMNAWRMRLVPAIAGSLMVPAMYFLARQLVRPRGALLVALLTATSAFFLNYSRDAKMYMPAWLFATLHIACVLWWLRGGGGLAWWCWVAAGVAAVGYHASSWLVVPIGFLALLTHGRPRLWWLLLYPLGIAIIGAGPLYYYANYNTWLERSGEITPSQQVPGFSPGGHWGASGISWIEAQTRRKTGPQLVRESATAYLFGYSRAEEEPGRDGTIPIPPAILDIAWGTLAVFIVIMVAGAVRWPRKQPDAHATPWSSWQLMLWLAAWTVLPTYALFYCRSMSEPTPPSDWFQQAWGYLGWYWLLIGIAAVAVGYAAGRWHRFNLAAALLLAIGLAGLIAVSVAQWRVQWYLGLMELTARPLVLGTLLVLAAGVSWASGGATTRQRALRLLAGVVAAGVIFVLSQVGWYVWDQARAAAKVSGRPLYSIWMPRYLAVIAPALLIVLAIAILRLPSRVLATVAVLFFVVANLTQFGARLYMDNEPRVDLLARDMVAGDRDPALAVYVRDRQMMGSPGSGGAYDAITRFYIAELLGPGNYNSLQMRMGPTDPMLKNGIHRMHSARWVVNDLKRKPEIKRLVLWQRKTLMREGEEAVLQKGLENEWELVDSWSSKSWRHWNWQEMDELVRTEYRRVESPAPAAKPATTRPAATRPAGARAAAARPATRPARASTTRPPGVTKP